MLVFSDHAFDVMFAVFFGKFRNVCKCAVDFSLAKFGCGVFVLNRVSGFVNGERGIRVVTNVSDDEFETWAAEQC